MDDPDEAGRAGNSEPVAYVPPPADDVLDAFPQAKRAKGKTRFAGGIRRRWKDQNNGRIYEWDYQHGNVEVYSSQGKHIGEYNPVTGQQTKASDPTKTVEP